jgi:hypothetical protein
VAVEVKPPHRRFQLAIRIDADTWADAQDELEGMLDHLCQHGPDREYLGGGTTRTGAMEVIEDQKMTPEKFQKELKAYNKARSADGK